MDRNWKTFFETKRIWVYSARVELMIKTLIEGWFPWIVGRGCQKSLTIHYVEDDGLLSSPDLTFYDVETGKLLFYVNVTSDKTRLYCDSFKLGIRPEQAEMKLLAPEFYVCVLLKETPVLILFVKIDQMIRQIPNEICHMTVDGEETEQFMKYIPIRQWRSVKQLKSEIESVLMAEYEVDAPK
jgi:hypothetical protein